MIFVVYAITLSLTKEKGVLQMRGHILELNENVTRKTVVYKNRYGLDITGELYLGKSIDLNKKYPALIVGAPYGGVKEQGPCNI